MLAQTIILAFESTHAALATQKQLAEFDPAVIPTPREVRAGCGMALKIELSEDTSRLEEVLSQLPQQDLSKDIYTVYTLPDYKRIQPMGIKGDISFE